MKLRPSASSAVISILLMVIMVSCNQGDIQVINQVKTFEPQWSNLREDLAWLERNLEKTEARFDKDISEIMPFKNRIVDSVGMRRFHYLKNQYGRLIVVRDSIREVFDTNKEKHSNAVEEFHEWERLVTKGEVEKEVALPKLEEFRLIHSQIDSSAGSSRTKLESIAVMHNKYLREMAASVDVLTNFDIELN